MGNQISKKPSPKGANRSLSEDFNRDYTSASHLANTAPNSTPQAAHHHRQQLKENSSLNRPELANINNDPDDTRSHDPAKSGSNSPSPASLLTTLPRTSTSRSKDGNPLHVDEFVASGTILPSQGQDSSEKRLSSLIGGEVIQPPPQAHTHDGAYHHHQSLQPFHQHSPQTGQAVVGPSTKPNNLQPNGQIGIVPASDPTATSAGAPPTPADASMHAQETESAKDVATTTTKSMQQHYDHIKSNIFDRDNNNNDSEIASENNTNNNDDNYGTPANGHDDHQQAHQQSFSSSNSKETLTEPPLDDNEQQEPSSPPPPEPSIPFAVLEPGHPILVKRPNLPPLTIPSASLTRSPPQSPKSSSLSRSLELSPTSRLPFLGSVTDKNKNMDLDDMISRLLDAGYSGKVSKNICLRNNEIVYICQMAREVFLSQPTLIELNAPVKIVGDIHGQYTDLLRMFEMCGFPPSANFLFLGDYVDRGKQSLETILLLFCYKIKYPENFFLLRGNHECANVTKVYGFYDECKRRASIKMWKAFVDVFNCLPLAGIVANKIFCVHGGLSPSLGTMDDIRALQRPTDVPDYGLLNDLLWSDPSDTALDWEDNERGVSYCFGRSIIQKFLNKHDFDLVCRAHMVVEDGYEFFNDRTLVTVFSAPNYCGEFDNFGAVMSVSEELLCSFELLKPIDQATAQAQMQSLAATNGGWRVNKQRLSIPDSNSLYGNSVNTTL
ncbi:hypothetical protein BGX27_002544 [Mortierella sp. AM989]|nr:hypothetical protein BGX27_002544 [Mortierella sp. AM989]